MDENETQIRIKVAKEISRDLTAWLENCAGLGRDAYGEYIEKAKGSILKKIISGGVGNNLEKKRNK